MHTSFRAAHSTLILRSRALARRLEGWPRARLWPILRDAAEEAAPQDEGSVGPARLLADVCMPWDGDGDDDESYHR
jgi:hypothetical protein